MNPRKKACWQIYVEVDKLLLSRAHSRAAQISSRSYPWRIKSEMSNQIVLTLTNSSEGLRDSASTKRFGLPGLYFSSNLYLAKKEIQRAFIWEIWNNYVAARQYAWSVYITKHLKLSRWNLNYQEITLLQASLFHEVKGSALQLSARKTYMRQPTHVHPAHHAVIHSQ